MHARWMMLRMLLLPLLLLGYTVYDSDSGLSASCFLIGVPLFPCFDDYSEDTPRGRASLLWPQSRLSYTHIRPGFPLLHIT